MVCLYDETLANRVAERERRSHCGYVAAVLLLRHRMGRSIPQPGPAVSAHRERAACGPLLHRGHAVPVSDVSLRLEVRAVWRPDRCSPAWFPAARRPGDPSRVPWL